MDAADALILAFLAVVDLMVMVHLRRARHRRQRAERVMRSMSLAVRRQNDPAPLTLAGSRSG